jgi:hypothetical protein
LKFVALADALVLEGDLHAFVEVRQLAQAVGQRFVELNSMSVKISGRA